MPTAGLAVASASPIDTGLGIGVGLIGPNAVIQLAEALRPYPGLAERVFARAGLSRLLNALPAAMIDEAIPARLFDALWQEVPPDLAADIAHQAGRLTGDYVLANRIPRLVRLVLRALPSRPASALLLKAIHKHAWTFAGTGQCHVQNGNPADVTIVGNPLCMPGCVWHVGVFESLFRALVNPATDVRHAKVSQGGTPASCFTITYQSRPKRQKDQMS